MKRFLLWIVFVISIIIPVYHVLSDSVNIFSLCWYFLSALLSWKLILPHKLPRPPFEHRDIVFIACATLVHLGMLTILSSQPVHFHYDEFIVAYTSFTLPSWKTINWFGVYPDFWVAQFPLLFNILQKPFLMFGPSIWAVRLSTWPYSIGIIIYVYWFASRVFDRSFARIAVLFHIFFAPTLYINSMGLHFISSELFYLAAMMHLMLYIQDGIKNHLYPLSLFIVASYLTYTASYSTLPVVLIIGLCAIFQMKHQRKTIALDIGKSLLVSFILFLPFLTFHTAKIPFMTQRSDQVNIFTGSWSDTKEKLASGTAMADILTKQTKTALRALILPKIGGIGEYEFGKQPLFHPLGAFLFFTGLIYLFVLLRGSLKIIAAAILVILLLPFVLGFILTTHPPPFHRITILFPIIAMIMAIPLRQYKKQFLFVLIIVILNGIISWQHVSTMIRKDRSLFAWDTPRIASYIKQHVPAGTNVYIAAFPTFHYKYELPFRLGYTYPIVEEHKKPILDSYKGDGPLIINRPEQEEILDILRRYPNSIVYTYLYQQPLKDVVLILP